jgi:hypothetical protein
MGQSKAYQWIHVLLPALRTLGDAFRNALLVDAPSRSFFSVPQSPKNLRKLPPQGGEFCPS